MSICEDISEFLDLLKIKRFVDDKIVNQLNTTVLTESFSNFIAYVLSPLLPQLVASHSDRDKALKDCLLISSEKLQKLRVQKMASPDDPRLSKQLRNERTKFRELQTQVNVEEVIQERSLKIYNEKCRSYYKPSLEDQSCSTTPSS